MKNKTAWKFLRTGMKSDKGNTKWNIGTWQKEEKIILCNRGFHCSDRIIDALGYVSGEILAKVEVKGDHRSDENKEVWQEMRVAKAYRWTKKDSVALAIYSAELVIDIFEKQYPNDPRPRQAIEAAKKVLKRDTAANRSAAESAAWSAARSAAESARSAAWSAESAAWSARSAAWSARSAAWSAESAAWSAWSAARSAAESARSAAESARSAAYEEMIEKIEKWMLKRVKKLKPV